MYNCPNKIISNQQRHQCSDNQIKKILILPCCVLHLPTNSLRIIFGGCRLRLNLSLCPFQSAYQPFIFSMVIPEHMYENKPQKIYTVLQTASTTGGEGRVNKTVFSVLRRCLPLIEFLRKKIKKKCLEDVICCPRQIVFFHIQNPAKRACSFVIPGKTFIPL